MISNLVVYQLVLIALVWVFLMLSWLWPSEPAAARPIPPTPVTPPRKRSTAPKPFPGLTRKPSCAACEQAIEAPRLTPLLRHPRRFLRHEAAAVMSTPPIISVPIVTVAMVAGSGWAISRPTVIPAVDRGASCIARAAGAISKRPTARRCMASASRPTCWYGPWARWRKAWASALSPGSSRSTRTRCCSGWSRWQTMLWPSRSISSTTCASRRCNWTNSLPCSVR